MNEKLRISRQGQELGTLPRREVCALLEAGFLRESDQFSSDGTAWAPLCSLKSAVPARGASFRLTMLGTAASSKLKNLAAIARANSASLASAAEKSRNAVRETLLQDYLTKLAEPVARHLSVAQQTAASALQNDVFLRKLFGAVYDSLPDAAHRFVDEQQFIDFCIKHKNRLLNSDTSEPSSVP